MTTTKPFFQVIGLLLFEGVIYYLIPDSASVHSWALLVFFISGIFIFTIYSTLSKEENRSLFPFNLFLCTLHLFVIFLYGWRQLFLFGILSSGHARFAASLSTILFLYFLFGRKKLSAPASLDEDNSTPSSLSDESDPQKKFKVDTKFVQLFLLAIPLFFIVNSLNDEKLDGFQGYSWGTSFEVIQKNKKLIHHATTPKGIDIYYQPERRGTSTPNSPFVSSIYFFKDHALIAGGTSYPMEAKDNYWRAIRMDEYDFGKGESREGPYKSHSGYFFSKLSLISIYPSKSEKLHEYLILYTHPNYIEEALSFEGIDSSKLFEKDPKGFASFSWGTSEEEVQKNVSLSFWKTDSEKTLDLYVQIPQANQDFSYKTTIYGFHKKKLVVGREIYEASQKDAYLKRIDDLKSKLGTPYETVIDEKTKMLYYLFPETTIFMTTADFDQNYQIWFLQKDFNDQLKRLFKNLKI